MACADIFQALKMVSESLGKDVHRKALNKSVWMNAVPKGVYPLGKGLTQTTFAIENSMPVNDELAWEQISNTAASGVAGIDTAASGLCQPTWNDVEWGFSEQTYSPERIAVRGPQICQSNLKYRYNVDVFMRAYLEEITKHSKRILENKIQNEYMKHARKVTLSGTAAAGDEALNDTAVDNSKEFSADTLADTVALAPGHLDQLAIKLIESGATEGDSNGWIELGSNGPVFPLIIGMEASNKLLKADPNVRTDYRESSKSNELLARLGADRVTGNFRHIVITNPARYVRHGYGGGSADGTYDRVSEHEAIAAGDMAKGTGTKLNTKYVSKDISDGGGVYEAAIALVPSVMKQLVVPSTTPGGLAFSPENYSGDWQFITGGYKTGSQQCDDPLEVYGRHYGQYELAFEPVFGDHGATVLFKRDGVVA